MLSSSPVRGAPEGEAPRDPTLGHRATSARPGEPGREPVLLPDPGTGSPSPGPSRGQATHPALLPRGKPAGARLGPGPGPPDEVAHEVGELHRTLDLRHVA